MGSSRLNDRLVKLLSTYVESCQFSIQCVFCAFPSDGQKSEMAREAKGYLGSWVKKKSNILIPATPGSRQANPIAGVAGNAPAASYNHKYGVRPQRSYQLCTYDNKSRLMILALSEASKEL